MWVSLFLTFNSDKTASSSDTAYSRPELCPQNGERQPSGSRNINIWEMWIEWIEFQTPALNTVVPDRNPVTGGK